MTENQTRPIGNSPKVSSNADLRIADDDGVAAAAITATGLDIDNDHADERPFNRSQDAPDDAEQDDEEARAEMLDVAAE